MQSWNEIHKSATAFFKRWRDACDENFQAQSFLKNCATKAIVCIPLIAMSGCFSMVESGLGRVDGGSGRVSPSTMLIDVVTLPAQVLFFTGLFLDYGFESAFTEKGRRKWAIEHGATASFKVKVLDEFGETVPDAIVKATFPVKHAKMLSSAITDSQGECLLIGATGGSVHFDVLHEHFYPSHFDFGFNLYGKDAHKVIWGSWQPDKIPVEIRLRKVKSPNAALSPARGYLQVPRLNEWIGYDLVENDFVFPEGEGKAADVKVKISWDGEWSSKMLLELEFLGAGAGGYLADKKRYSNYKGVYSANLDAEYKSHFVFAQRRGPTRREAASGDNPVMLFDETSILVARAARGGVSGCVDGNGNAYRYFQIYDLSFGRGDKAGTASLRMRCIYNPTLGDTALEDFDTYDTSMKLTRKERMELKK